MTTGVRVQAELTKARLERAEKLQGALGDEGVRWSQSAEDLGRAIELLVGDVFVSAAVISYQGAFTAPYRQELCARWTSQCAEKGVPITEGVSVRATLGSPVEIREWNIFGLPTDDVSVDNGIMVKHGYRWPLMIDPQVGPWVTHQHCASATRRHRCRLIRHPGRWIVGFFEEANSGGMQFKSAGL